MNVHVTNGTGPKVIVIRGYEGKARTEEYEYDYMVLVHTCK